MASAIWHNDVTCINWDSEETSTSSSWIYFRNKNKYLHFLSLLTTNYGAGSWNPPPWKTRIHLSYMTVNTLRPRQDGRHFADDSFTCIFFNENCCILIKFSLKYVRKGPIDNNRALVQIMAWRRSGDKPLSEPMMISLPTHMCTIRPQWVNTMAAAGLVMEGAMASTVMLLPLSPEYPCFSCYKLNPLLLSYNYCLKYWPHSGWPIGASHPSS